MPASGCWSPPVARVSRSTASASWATAPPPGAASPPRGELERKRLDGIVVNDISRAGIGFEADENEVTILTRDGIERHVPQSRKERVARAVLEEVERLRAARVGTDGARADTRSPARV